MRYLGEHISVKVVWTQKGSIAQRVSQACVMYNLGCEEVDVSTLPKKLRSNV